MIYLGIDTSTAIASVAVCQDDVVLAQIHREAGREQTELLTPMIAAALTEAAIERNRIDVVIVGVGPGPFTGLRVGIVTGLVFAHALDIPCHGVCSLDASARAHVREVHPTESFSVAFDAKRREVFWARFDATGTRTSEPSAAPASDVPLPVVTGSPNAVDVIGEARDVLVSGGKLLPAQPMYVRAPDVTLSTGPKRVTP